MVKWLCFLTAYCLSLLYGCEVVDKNIKEVFSLSQYMCVCVCIYMHVYLLVVFLSDNECYNYSIL